MRNVTKTGNVMNVDFYAMRGFINPYDVLDAEQLAAFKDGIAELEVFCVVDRATWNGLINAVLGAECGQIQQRRNAEVVILNEFRQRHA